MSEADLLHWNAKGETSPEACHENQAYPMKINGFDAVMACRSSFSFVSQKG